MPDWLDRFKDAASWSPPDGVAFCVRVSPCSGWEVSVSLMVDGTTAMLLIPAGRSRSEVHAALDHAVRCLSPWPSVPAARDCPCGCNDTPYAVQIADAGRAFRRGVLGADECDQSV